LVQAFHSTLEEVTNAQLLLHVVDCAASEREIRIDEVNAVLKEIDADEIPTITVFNKLDLTDKSAKRLIQADGQNERVWVSAHTGEGLDLLLLAIQEQLSRDFQTFHLSLPPKAAQLRAKLFAKELILHETITEQGYFSLRLRLSPSDIGWLKKVYGEYKLEPVKLDISDVA